MSRLSTMVMSAWLLAVCCTSGCAMMESTRNWLTGAQDEQSEPAVEDKWASVGKEGRGNRKKEKEDPLDRFLMSDKARDINRNVGFE